MLVTLFGIVTFVKSVQLANVQSPMLVTLFGIVTFVKSVQFTNAQSPILVTLFGIVTFVKLVQYQNAKYPIFVTLSGMIILVRFLQASISSALNALPPILVTLFPSITDGNSMSVEVELTNFVISTVPSSNSSYSNCNP